MAPRNAWHTDNVRVLAVQLTHGIKSEVDGQHRMLDNLVCVTRAIRVYVTLNLYPDACRCLDWMVIGIGTSPYACDCAHNCEDWNQGTAIVGRMVWSAVVIVWVPLVPYWRLSQLVVQEWSFQRSGSQAAG